MILKKVYKYNHSEPYGKLIFFVRFQSGFGATEGEAPGKIPFRKIGIRRIPI